MYRLTEFVLRRPGPVLIVTLALVIVGGIFGTRTFGMLKGGGFDDPDAESGRAAQVLQEKFGAGTANMVLLVRPDGGVDAPAAASAGTALTNQLAGESGVRSAISYWTLGNAPTLRSRDGTQALVLVTIAGDADEVAKRLNDLLPRYEGRRGTLDVTVGGSAMAGKEMAELTQEDASRGEMIIFPITLIVLVLVFGSVVAALLPLMVAFGTLLLALLLLGFLAGVTDLSIFVLNVVSFLGLGLAIDYSLLIVSRYREELRRGLSTDDAIRATMRTAGRTVLFSAVTVALALVGLAVFPLFALSSMAYAGVVTALLAAFVSLVALPAMLRVLGPRIDKWRILPARRRTDDKGFWHRLATFVMRRPVPVGTAVLVLLLVLGAPVLGMKLRIADETVLPEGTSSRAVAEAVRADFDSRDQDAIQVVAERADQSAVDGYASRLSALPGVVGVQAVTGMYEDGRRVAEPTPQSQRFVAQGATYLSVIPEADAFAPEAADLAQAIRDLEAPFPVLVGGAPAASLDTMHGITDPLPLAITIMLVAMFVLLFMITGSLLMPLIAMVLSVLSLSATFGALVLIFQDGHLTGLLGGMEVTGTLVAIVPVMLFALAFGLAMDYQVFLLSRIREEYLRTGEPTAAVAAGLQRTGRIVTAAALLISIVFAAFIPSGVTYMKAFGVGLPLAVLMDATLVRGVLLPAFLRIAGRAAWWAPPGLRRFHSRYGMNESDPVESAPEPARV